MPAVLPDPVDQVRDDIAKRRHPDMTEKFEQMRRREELRGLERDAIEAAKAELLAADEYEKHLIAANYKRSIETRLARQAAVRALINFEAQEK